MPELEEVIRDLLHPTLGIRKKAFSEVKQNWQMDMRPYIWLAIENENTDFQAEIVEFVINEIKDKSLRKMIRFVEKGQLRKKSMTHVIRGFTMYENLEVREALIKSIKREHSKTYEFVMLLLKSKNLEDLPDTSLDSLFSVLFGSTIPEDLKLKFVKAIVKRKNRHFTSRPYFLGSIIDNFGEDTTVRRGILEETSLDQYLWHRWDWKEEEPAKFGKLDTFLLHSINSPDQKVRERVIQILAGQVIIIPFEKMEHRDVLFDVWDKLTQWKKEADFLSLKSYELDRLSNFFSGELENYLNELLMFEIHPFDLVKHITAYFPRKKLIQLSREDPMEENRLLCFQSLTQRNFWVQQISDGNNIFIGPYGLWAETISRCLIALKFETNEEIWISCINLLNLLTDLTIELENTTRQKLINLFKSSGIFEKLNNLGEISFFKPIVSKMKTVFEGSPLIIGEDESLSTKTAIFLVKQYLESIHEENSLESLLNILKSPKIEIRKVLIDEISNFIKNELTTTEKIQTNIRFILENACNDDNIRIRTYATLLLKKI
ncbi:MAG: hypothetical protein ACXAD7_05715 [Candidatus Kariarchaeaceae archaeon]|jgi:hypothetical protein